MNIKTETIRKKIQEIPLSDKGTIEDLLRIEDVIENPPTSMASSIEKRHLENTYTDTYLGAAEELLPADTYADLVEQRMKRQDEQRAMQKRKAHEEAVFYKALIREVYE